MKWECKQHKKIHAKKAWHDSFCFIPRRISQDFGPTLWVWLETVERKGELVFDPDGDYWLYSYRLKNK
jgi:hypothetical protein